MFYNTTNQAFQYCDGTDWIPMHVPGSGSGGCSNPARPEKTIIYNSYIRVLQACAGNVWRAMGKTAEQHCDALSNAETQTAPTSEWWSSVTYGNGTFVAVGGSVGSNRAMTSPDGINWTLQTAAEMNTWISVTYGNGLFVAVAYNGTNRIMTSPDGVTWTPRAAPEANAWYDVTYGNGLFVAVSTNGTNRVMTSPDGITWTPRAAEASNWRGVTYGGGQFVAVAEWGTNRVMTSPDGINWTPQTAAAADAWESVAYGNGVYVATSYDGTVMTSPDAITWTPQTPAEAGNRWINVNYGNGLFVAVSEIGTYQMMSSPDGVTWTGHTLSASSGWYDAVYANGRFVAVRSSGAGAKVATVDCIDDSLLPSGCTNVGDECDDGSYYIGQLDGKEIYATAAASESTETWNDGSTINWTVTGFTSTTDGEGNTTGLVAASGNADYPYNAAEYCAGLISVHGHRDWYLPASDELNLFWNGGSPVAGVLTAGTWYWSSTEDTHDRAWRQRFSDGVQNSTSQKSGSRAVRCVRTHTVDEARCLNPSRPKGSLFYNKTEKLMQYCNGANWVAIGKEPLYTPAGCYQIGDLCDDGSIFAGDTNMFVTAVNQSTGIPWNPFEGNDDINPDSDTDGEANHANVNVPFSDLPAMNLCETLVLHGKKDWYLPAKDELYALYTNKAAIEVNATDNFAGDHWSSSEFDSDYPWSQRFTDGTQMNFWIKYNTLDVRCVRRAGAPDPCDDPAVTPGTTCLDGSIYIGQISGADIYSTSPTHESAGQTWNNTVSSPVTGATSTSDGFGNTAILVASADAGAPYPAANYCDGLSGVHGHSDWYLPAQDELNLFWNGGSPVAGILVDGSLYWTSTEVTNAFSWTQRFNDGSQINDDKIFSYPVRCVRK